MRTNGGRLFSAVAPGAVVALLLTLLAGASWTPPALAGTKTLTGKLRAVDDKVLTVEEKKLLDTTSVAVEMDKLQTKVTGELTPGMMIKITYREDAKGDAKDDAKDSVRRIAVKVKTWPEYSSRRDRKAAPTTPAVKSPRVCRVRARVKPWHIAASATAGAAAGIVAWGAAYPTSQPFGFALCRTLQRSEIALTFDDGPNPAVTPRLLDLLARHDVRATFFLIGRFARRCPQLVREIAARGHALGNHSETHPNLALCSSTRIAKELNRCQDSIASALHGSATATPM